MKKYTLANSLSVASYGSNFYIYDARLGTTPFADIATQKLTPSVYSILKVFLLNHGKKTPRTREALLKLAETAFQPGQSDPNEVLDFLIESGYLRPENEAPDHEAQIVAKLTARYSDSRTADRQRFEQLELQRRYSPHTFFNLPEDISDEDVSVALQGLPLVTMNPNLGSHSSPDLLRATSREVNWLKAQQNGFYSEISLVDNKPDILCKETVVKDYGDVDFANKSIAEIFSLCDDRVARFFDRGIRPLYIGGDHGISFPLITALQKRIPDLHVLHLDAHNDLFYAKEITFLHSAPISNLIRYTDLSKVLSFGVRTVLDHRTDNLTNFYRNDACSDRVDLFNLIQTKKFISEEVGLREKLRAFGDKPFYLTLDLDVLSDRECQVSTTLGEGLTWHELFQFIVIAFEECNIIGCDISEFNALGTITPYRNNMFLNTLLVLLIDRLAKNKGRDTNHPSPKN